MIVVDASAVVDLLLRGPRGETVREHVERAEVLLAPDLLVVEVASALHRLTRSGDLLRDQAAANAMRSLERLPVTIVPHRRLIATAWLLADRLRVADAFYVACARLVRLPLLTTNSRLSRAGVTDVVVTLVR